MADDRRIKTESPMGGPKLPGVNPRPPQPDRKPEPKPTEKPRKG